MRFFLYINNDKIISVCEIFFLINEENYQKYGRFFMKKVRYVIWLLKNKSKHCLHSKKNLTQNGNVLCRGNFTGRI